MTLHTIKGGIGNFPAKLDAFGREDTLTETHTGSSTSSLTYTHRLIHMHRFTQSLYSQRLTHTDSPTHGFHTQRLTHIHMNKDTHTHRHTIKD